MMALKERARLDVSLLARQRDTVAHILAPGDAPENSFAPVVPPFCRKGEASAEQFRPQRQATRPLVLLPAAAIGRATLPVPALGGSDRLWIRVGPERRQELKAAAASRGQTCQEFLLDAIDAFLGGHDADAVSNSLAVAPWRPPVIHGHRVKLSVRVDPQRHCAMKRRAARTGETVQSLLIAALQQHLARAGVQPAIAGLPLPLCPSPGAARAPVAHCA